jgi:hypothetical protein
MAPVAASRITMLSGRRTATAAMPEAATTMPSGALPTCITSPTGRSASRGAIAGSAGAVRALLGAIVGGCCAHAVSNKTIVSHHRIVQ